MRKRVFFQWHSVIGLTAGLMLFIICWSGTVAVFAYEIDWLLDRSIRSEAPRDEMDWGAIAVTASDAHPGERISWIAAPRHEGFAAVAVMETQDGVLRRVYVDASSHELLGTTSFLNVQRFFRSLHMALFQADYFAVLGIPVGYFVVLLFAFPLAAMLVTSLVFYKRWWRGFTKLETRQGARAFWSDAHKLCGVWSLPLIAITCITSFWYLAEWWLPRPDRAEPAAVSGEDRIGVAGAVAVTRAAFPELDIRMIMPPGQKDPVYWLQGHDGGFLVRGRASIQVDKTSGAVKSIVRTRDLGVVDRLKETVDVLHFGTFGGLWTQALYFVLGLAVSGLALSGAYLHAQRRKRGSERRHVLARREIVAAYGLTVLLLALAIKAGFDELSGYAIDATWPETPVSVILFLASWMLVTVGALTAWCWKLR